MTNPAALAADFETQATETTGPTDRRRSRRRLRGLAVGAAVGLGLLAGSLPASAAVYNGNYCNSATWYEQTVGGAACTYLPAINSSYLTLQLGALDAVQDGLSIRNTTRVDQYTAAGAYLGSTNPITLSNSAGAVTTNFGSNVYVARRSGAGIFRIVLTATRFNAPNGAIYNSNATSWGYRWPS